MLPDPAARKHYVTGKHDGDASALRPLGVMGGVRAGRLFPWWRAEGGDGAADIKRSGSRRFPRQAAR